MLIVKDNIKDVTRSLTRVQRRQIPFATVGALNSTAFAAQREIKRQLPRKFILRNRWTESGVQVRKANKRNMTATVLMGRGREYMARQEEGGIKRPHGQHLAVPSAVRRSKRQKITKAKRPSAVLAKPRTFKATIGGQPGIYQRRGRKRGPLKLLYALERQVRIRPRFGFKKTAGGVAKNTFNRHFRVSLERGLRTAR